MKSKFTSFSRSVFLAVFVLLFTQIGEVLGQRYQTRTYTETDGLANSFVLDMVQDSAGVLWIARRSGISSYDGLGFTNYTAADGLRLTTYAFLVRDEKEQLWAIPESGTPVISHWNGSKWSTLSSQDKKIASLSTTFTSLDVFYEDGEPVIVAGSYNGILWYKKGKWRHITTVDGLPVNTISCVTVLDGSLFISCEKGLFTFEKGRFRTVSLPNAPWSSGKILTMARSGDSLWMMGKDWLGYYSQGKYTPVTSGFLIPSGGAGWRCFLYPARNGKVFFGNIHVVYRFSAKTGKPEIIDRKSGLISEGATSILLDREWNTWISGYRGITKIPSERFMVFSDKDGLFSTEVASAIELSPGKFAFGHDDALTFYDGRTMSPLILDPEKVSFPTETRLLDLCADGKGGLWIAASSLGLANIDSRRKISWFREKEGIEGSVTSVAIASDRKVWVGTSSGLYVLENALFRKKNIGFADQNGIRKIIPGKNGEMFLPTITSGLMVIKGDSIHFINSPDNPLANNVYSFYTDRRGNKWVGTAAGLYFVNEGALQRVNRDGLAINRPVYLIIEGRQHDLWFGTDNGVYRWNEKVLDNYSVNDGLSGQEINRSAGILDSKGRLWFGTNNGITIFQPEFDYKPGLVPAPKVSILQVIAGNDTVAASQKTILPYSHNDLTFSSRVISFINERQIQIRYYLEGFDTGWSAPQPYVTSRFVYNNLRPGTYRFHIRASNPIGTWSDPVVSSAFTIRPPIWFSWWFICLALIIISGVIALTLRIIFINRYKNRLKEEVMVRTRELINSEKKLKESNRAKDSFFSIIAHDLRNPFNVILGYLDLLTHDDADYSEEEQKNILLKLKSASVRTINLLENLLTWARAQRGSLPFEPELFQIDEIIGDNLGLFEAAANSKSISLKHSGLKDVVVFADRNMISTVVRNLISNAIKFTYPGGIITLLVEQKLKSEVLISVQDNGTGISPELMEKLFKIEQRTIVRGTASETGTGLGLILCKEFVERNKGSIWVKSVPGTGSVFTFSIPVSNDIFNNL